MISAIYGESRVLKSRPRSGAQARRHLRRASASRIQHRRSCALEAWQQPRALAQANKLGYAAEAAAKASRQRLS